MYVTIQNIKNITFNATYTNRKYSTYGNLTFAIVSLPKTVNLFVQIKSFECSKLLILNNLAENETTK